MVKLVDAIRGKGVPVGDDLFNDFQSRLPQARGKRSGSLGTSIHYRQSHGLGHDEIRVSTDTASVRVRKTWRGKVFVESMRDVTIAEGEYPGTLRKSYSTGPQSQLVADELLTLLEDR